MRQAIEVRSEFESRGIQEALFKMGYGWNSIGENYYDMGAIPYCIAINENKRLTCGSRDYFERNGGVVISFVTDTKSLKEILNPSKPITKLELNTEYTAEIDPNTETVKVGCRTFTFAKIKELASKL